MTPWEMFVAEFYKTLPVWFVGTLALGWWLGWKACELIRFGEIKMRMHERRILHHIRQAEKRNPFGNVHVPMPVKEDGKGGVVLDSSPG